LEVIPAREFNFLYIYLDSTWLLILFFIFIYTKRYLAIIAGLAGAAIYFIVDYGIFYLLLGTRTVSGANPEILLLWLSVSYGFTNFAWIWLWLDRDDYSLEWSILIISGWFTTALLSKNFGSNFTLISIQRGTSSYHGVMALILLVGYSILIIKNIKRSGSGKERINILRILSIGIFVQFSWETVLLISGIRNPGFMPLIVNSLLETNLGLPYLFLIHRAISTRFEENLHRKMECIK
jgi:hypothetical protein